VQEHQHPSPPLVACVNSSEDVTQLVADYLRQYGFRAVTFVTPIRFGTEPLIKFVTDLQPDACIFTVSIPYAESWQEFLSLRRAAPNVAFVVTTTNQRAFDEIIGPIDEERLELFGKPYDLDEVCRAVRRALDRRAPSAAGDDHE